ncbi:MAG: ABC transporter substrate-binding protein [Dehalococcoidia bacterium]
MRHRWRAFAFVAMALGALALAFAACGGDDDDDGTAAQPAAAATNGASPAASANTAAFPFTFTDSTGTQVAFGEAPKRIISYSPGATEVLFAVGAGAQVIAVDEFSDYPAAAKALPHVQYSKPSPEPALAMKPDLVILAGQQAGQVPQFRQLGMRVVLLKEPGDVPAVFEQIKNVGRMTGHGEDAAKLVTSLEGRLEKVKGTVAAKADAPVVFYEITPDLFTVSPNSFVGNLLTIAKAKNLVTDTSNAFPQLSVETVLKADPAVILLADGGDDGGQTPEMVKARPGWDKVKAVRDGRVVVIDSDVFSRPGPRVLDALEQLVAVLYPPR